MSPYETYKLYLALKQHFTSDYDFFRYSGHVTAKEDTFKKRKDKYFFEKLAKHKNPRDFIVANIINKQSTYIKDLAYSQDCKDTYAKWRKIKESITYTFSNDLKKLKHDFNSNFHCDSTTHPHILKLYLAGEIHLETVCILCGLTSSWPYWNKQLKDDILWNEYGLLIRKYMPFVDYDKDKLKSILLKQYKD